MHRDCLAAVRPTILYNNFKAYFDINWKYFDKVWVIEIPS